MATGDNRHYVTLEESDGSGYVRPLVPPDWYCAVRSESGTEVAFTGAHHAGITTLTRIHFKGRIYQVTRVDNLEERDAVITVHASEAFD